MNIDSKLLQTTIQSLLPNVTPTPNVLTTPDISKVVSISQTSSNAKFRNKDKRRDDHDNKLLKKHEQGKDNSAKANSLAHDAVNALYDNFNAAIAELAADKNNGCLKFQETMIDVHSQIPRPETFSDKFISREMREYIKNKSKKNLTFECKIHDRDIRIFFILFHRNCSEESVSYYKKYAHRIFIWLHMISFKSDCVESLNIYIYLTPFIKELPQSKSEVIGPVHANTGYTYRCQQKNEIVIYREEEWFKVLLHETIHSFGNDFEQKDEDYDSMVGLRKIFSLPKEANIQISETYSETWARIMNVAFQTYFKDPPSLESQTAEQFKKNFEFYLNLEGVFSLYQCIKILDFMGLSYRVLIDNSEHSKNIMHSFYRENTHIFAYYVLTSILLHSHDDFLSWCIKKNGPDLNIFKVKATQRDFIRLIASCYKKNDLLQKIVETETKVARDYENMLSVSEMDKNQIVTTLRMTIVGFD
jgi:hypothetical protein